jgi:hypothetical protein
MEVYCGDNIGKGMDTDDKNDWFEFLQQLSMLAKRNLLSFSVKNLNHLKYTMQGQAAIKEGLFESWRGTRTISYNDAPENVRLMVKHKRPLGETDARYRYIESLFLETSDGERYRLPFTKLAGGRAMVEHVKSGGLPYDARGQHIVQIVNELNVLSRFNRANHSKIFEGESSELISEAHQYYESLQKTLKSLSTSRGYNSYFESWDPSAILESDLVIEDVKNLFIEQTLDTRIEEALPILARLRQQGNDMKEAQIFESWANQLMEGTWSLPDTKEKQAQLLALMSKDLPVGPDATNATEQLYSIFGDDQLFDQLHDLADVDPNADARSVVMSRLEDFSSDPNVAAVVSQLGLEATDDQIDDGSTEVTDMDLDTEMPMEEEYKYDETLSSILKHAGVEPQDKPAVSYEVSDYDMLDEEGSLPEYVSTIDGEANPGVAPEQDLDEASIAEAKKPGTKVQILKGPRKGTFGWVGEVHHGMYKGAPKQFVIDFYDEDNNYKGSDRFESNALRIIKDAEVFEDQDGISVEELTNVLCNRIMHRNLDLLKEFGPKAVMAACEDVAEFHAGVEELGTSDISIMLRQVETDLRRNASVDETPVTGVNHELSRLKELAQVTDEGWKGHLAGGTIGDLAGTAIGSSVAGPVGAIVGGALGGTAGGMIGDKLGDDKSVSPKKGEKIADELDS